MNRFSSLILSLEQTRDAAARAALLESYLRTCTEEEATWTAALLLGVAPPRVMTPAECRSWFLEASALPEWLAEVCHIATDDPAETAALALPHPVSSLPELSLPALIASLTALARSAASARKEAVITLWNQLGPGPRRICNVLLQGLPPLVLPAGDIARAAAGAFGGSAPLLEHRIQEGWDPGKVPLAVLAASTTAAVDHSRPYPFAPREPLVSDLGGLGEPADWSVSLLPTGIRVQLVRRAGEAFLWAETGELLNARYPATMARAAALPDGTVLEGVLAGAGEKKAATRGKRRSSRRGAAGSSRGEAVLYATDLHELAGTALPSNPFGERLRKLRTLLQELPAGAPMLLAEPLPCITWDEMRGHWAGARQHGAAGLALARTSAPMHAPDALLLWPVDPLLVTTVLLYAEQGIRTGRGYARFTVAVWDGGRLVPVASVAPDLPPADAGEVAAHVAAHTAERFGPVRTVRPGIVLEVAFDRLEPSARRKSGLLLLGARLLRLRRDLPPESASTLEYLRSLLPPR